MLTNFVESVGTGVFSFGIYLSRLSVEWGHPLFISHPSCVFSSVLQMINRVWGANIVGMPYFIVMLLHANFLWELGVMFWTLSVLLLYLKLGIPCAQAQVLVLI